MQLDRNANAAEVIDGLTLGELRARAAAWLGADVAAGMGINELLEWFSSE